MKFSSNSALALQQHQQVVDKRMRSIHESQNATLFSRKQGSSFILRALLITDSLLSSNLYKGIVIKLQPSLFVYFLGQIVLVKQKNNGVQLVFFVRLLLTVTGMMQRSGIICEVCSSVNSCVEVLKNNTDTYMAVLLDLPYEQMKISYQHIYMFFGELRPILFGIVKNKEIKLELLRMGFDEVRSCLCSRVVCVCACVRGCG